MENEDLEDKKRKACLEKLTWSTKEMAEAAAVYARWQHEDAKTKVYNCKYCGKWHLARAL